MARSYFLRDLDPGLRYGPAISAARGARRVLEVGSGPAGIAPFVRRRVTGVDLSFAGPRDRKLMAVRARGSALPFGDGAFDLVLCFDVLEHVPPGDREALAREMARVCGGTILIAVPFGPASRAADERAAALHRRVYGAPHRWLDEHLAFGTPDAEGVERLCQAIGCEPARRRVYTPLWLWWLLRKEEALLRPHLSIIRRVLLWPFAPLLWRLPTKRGYRLLLELRPPPRLERGAERTGGRRP